jgi:hypothetical protein
VVAAAVAVAVVAGVGIPVRMFSGSPAARVVPGKSSDLPAAPKPLYSYGGIGITSLPDGMRHTSDLTTRVSGNQVSLSTLSADPPGMTSDVGLLGPTTFISEYEASAGASPRFAWVTVMWKPPYKVTPDTVEERVSRTNALFSTSVQETPTTFDGMPAAWVTLARPVSDTVVDRPAFRESPPERRFTGALIWALPNGAALSVELAGPAPQDQAVAARIARGLVVGTQPPSPYAVDAATDTAVRAVFHDAFAAGVPAATWSAAVQDGPALVGLRAKVLARFPGLARTEAVDVSGMSTVEVGKPDQVEVGMTLSFTDATVHVPGQQPPAGRWDVGLPGYAVRTASGWRVTRATFCGLVAELGVPELSCPPA